MVPPDAAARSSAAGAVSKRQTPLPVAAAKSLLPSADAATPFQDRAGTELDFQVAPESAEV